MRSKSWRWVLLAVLSLVTQVPSVFAQTEPISPPIRLADGSYVGEIRAFAGSMAPEGWLICDGKEYPIVTGKTDQLHKVIGTLWGSSKQNHFRVPDLRGQFLRGWNAGRLPDHGGDADLSRRYLPSGSPGSGDPNSNKDRVGSQQVDAVVEHTHVDAGHSHSYVYRNDFACGDRCGAATGAGPSGSLTEGKARLSGAIDVNGKAARTGDETHPKNVYVIFAIRNQVALPKDFVTERTTSGTSQ